MARKDPRQAFLEEDERQRFGGAVGARHTHRARLGRATYLLTSAQNNTRVHPQLWRNLLAYREFLGAQLLVSQFTYNKGAYLARDVGGKPGTVRAGDHDDLWYDEPIKPYVWNDRLAISKGLLFCGEINILPTAANPLSGFENYTGRASGIFPHAKFAMQSIASPMDQPTKFNYTTGVCTLRNYLQKKAGLKAEALHGYGALIVEVDAAGDWWVRQLHATDNGDFQDLDVVVAGGRVSTGNRVEAINWGDIHVEQLDPVVRRVQWGRGGILDTLKPRYQFLHDTLDFKSRNHHDSRNPHEAFRKWVDGRESVEQELRDAAKFIAVESKRPFCTSIVVDSNHDRALMRYLREAEFRADPVNARFYLRAQRLVYDALAAGRKHFHLLKTLMRHFGVPADVRFLDEDESFVICKSTGGIECGMHGHAGPNGSRGSPRALARMGRPVNSGHTHVAGIIDDCCTAGTSSKLDMGYNKGAPSSWSHSLIVTYANGRRTILTIWKGKSRA